MKNKKKPSVTLGQLQGFTTFKKNVICYWAKKDYDTRNEWCHNISSLKLFVVLVLLQTDRWHHW